MKSFAWSIGFAATCALALVTAYRTWHHHGAHPVTAIIVGVIVYLCISVIVGLIGRRWRS